MDIKNRNIFRAVGIVAAGVVIAAIIILAKPSPQPELHQEPPPHVAEVVAVELGSHAITVTSQGTVTPKTQIDITARVSGEVVSVGEHFAAGGFFAAGEVLLTIDPSDYEIALVRAESALADARNALAQEEGQARQAKREWRDLGNQIANDLFLRKPQLEATRAAVAAAEAGVRQARLDLERTRISLPFDGRVVSVDANLGQFVSVGNILGTVYAADIMEVRLPLTAAELRLLNMQAANQLHEIKPLTVDLYFRAGNNVLEWQGRVVRLEARVDTSSRLFYLVAEIDNRVTEFTDEGKPLNRSPMLPGTFVEAMITSNPHDGVAVLPRSALYQSDQVFVLDEEDRLRLQQVVVMQLDSEVLVAQGLEDGRRVLARPPSFMDLGAVYTAVHVDAPVVDSPAVDAPEVDSPEAENPAVESPAGESPVVDSPEVDSPEVDSPEVESLEVDIPGEDSPEVDKPELYSPEVNKPELYGPELDSPEDAP